MPYRRNDDDWTTIAVTEFFQMLFAFMLGIVGVFMMVVALRRERQSNQKFADTLSPSGHLNVPSQRIHHTSPYFSKLEKLVRLLVIVGIVCAVLGGLIVLRTERQLLTQVSANVLIVSLICLVLSLSYYATKILFVKPSIVPLSSTEAVVPVSNASKVYTITLAKQTTWEARRALQLVEQLLFTFHRLIFRIVADHKTIRWQIVDIDGRSPDTLCEAIRAQYPSAEVVVEDLNYSTPETPFHRYTLLYTQPNPFAMPMQYITEVKDPEPLIAVVQSMNDLEPGEKLEYTLVIVGALPAAKEEGFQQITQSTIHPLQYFTAPGMVDAAIKVMTNHDRTERYVPEQQRLLNEKLDQLLYQAALMVQIDAPSIDRIAHIARIDGHIFTATVRHPYNGLLWHEEPVSERIVEVRTDSFNRESSAVGRFLSWIDSRENPSAAVVGIRRATRLVLETRELALLWHLPHEKMSASRIRWQRGVQAEMDSALVDEPSGVQLGWGKQNGKSYPVHLPDSDRKLHINIVGKSGMGKSTFMHHLIRHDIECGVGLAVIDPHGTLIKDILQTSIPSHRESDVVLLDLADKDNPPPLNPLRGHSTYVGLGRVVNVIERMFAGTEGHARLSKYLRAAIGLLAHDEHATMRDVSRVFTDEEYRYKLLESGDNGLVEEVWNAYELLSQPQREQIIDPILNRIAPFFSNPLLLPVFCHPDGLNFGTLMQERKIILVSLKMSAADVPDKESDLVGALLISMLQLSGMEESTETFYIYIDEVQRFTTTSLPIMFSEARKFGLALTVANQMLDQLRGDTLKAVMGNASTTICFRTGTDDAHALASYFSPAFSADGLQSLDQHQAAVKMQYRGQNIPAFTLWSPSPVQRPDDATEREQRIRALSGKQYTKRSAEDVKAWLAARYPKPKRKTDKKAEDEFYG